MKTFGLTSGAIVMGALILIGSVGSAAAGSAKDEITEKEKKMIAATSADELMKFYDDQDVTVYDIPPPLQFKGVKAVHGDFDEFFKNANDLKGELVELAVVAEGNMGMARSIQHFTWKDKDGKAVEATLRVTDVFHKVKGDWKVIHSHISIPVDLKTNQGQLNLKP
jgi:ketosteroid isomerase-like protein